MLKIVSQMNRSRRSCLPKEATPNNTNVQEDTEQLHKEVKDAPFFYEIKKKGLIFPSLEK